MLGTRRGSITDLMGMLPNCPNFEKQLSQFQVILGMQSAQIAVCTGFHGVDQRLCRWLLMAHDRMGDISLSLTQDLIAEILGSRRASVTGAASALQRGGLIEYSRGNVRIKSRKGLEERSCDCYKIIEEQQNKWLAEAAS